MSGATPPRDRSKLDTDEIRRLAVGYPGGRLITQTIPALCDEVDRLRRELAEALAPWWAWRRLHESRYYYDRIAPTAIEHAIECTCGYRTGWHPDRPAAGPGDRGDCDEFRAHRASAAT